MAPSSTLEQICRLASLPTLKDDLKESFCQFLNTDTWGNNSQWKGLAFIELGYLE